MQCDSYVRPATLVRVCDECNYGSYAGRCVICGGLGVSDAFYCKECTIQEKDVSAVPGGAGLAGSSSCFLFTAWEAPGRKCGAALEAAGRARPRQHLTLRPSPPSACSETGAPRSST